LTLGLDGKITTVLLNKTINGSAVGATPAFTSDNMEDGDHQLYGEVESRKKNGPIVVDHFECVAPTPLYSNDSALTISSFPGLRIRLERG